MIDRMRGLSLGCVASMLLSGCATLPGQRLSLADAQASVIAANGNADAATLLEFAGGLVRAGNYVQALSVLEGETQPNAPDARWLNLLGACRGELGDKTGARRAFEAAQALGSDAAKQNLALLDHGPARPVADSARAAQ
jgi:Flp pilus assembly protein TadD